MAPPQTRAAQAPDTYVLVYDGGCPFCVAAARWVENHAREPLRVMTYEDVAGSGVLQSLSKEELVGAAHLITPEGREFHAGEAVTRALRLTPWSWLGRGLDLPLIASMRDAGYWMTAQLRPWLSRFVRTGR